MDNLKNILDITYELEGLVELTLRRPATNDTIIPLIKNKISALSEAARELDCEASMPPAIPETTQEYSDTDMVVEDTVEATDIPLPPVFTTPMQEEDDEPLEPDTTELLDAPEAAAPFGRLPFSINDKFLFRRELFGNNTARYNQALDIIAEMSTLDEVRDYLCNDLELDENATEVQAFLERVRVLSEQ